MLRKVRSCPGDGDEDRRAYRGRARAKPRREAGTGTPRQRVGAVGTRTCSEDLDLLLTCRVREDNVTPGPGERGRPAAL